MKRKTAGRVAKPRICAKCGAPIAEQRPVFLLTAGSGQIVGPYHAGCAERIHIDVMKLVDVDLGEAKQYGRIVPPAREETLPW